MTIISAAQSVAAALASIVLNASVSNAQGDQPPYRNIITVTPGYMRHGKVQYGFGSVRTMKLSDVEAIRKACPSIQAVAPSLQRRFDVRYRSRQTRTSVSGTGVDAPRVFGQQIRAGRYFNTSEVKSANRVCVLGDAVCHDLFGNDDPVNKSVRIGGRGFLVIGVFKTLPGQGFRDPNDAIYVPITTVMQHLTHESSLGSIHCLARSAGVIDRATAELTKVLMKEHKIATRGAKDFVIFSDRDFSQPPSQSVEDDTGTLRTPRPPTKVLEIMPGQQRRGSISFGFGSTQTMKLSDVEAIRKGCPSIEQVTPAVNRTLTMKYKDKVIRTTVAGTGEDAPLITNLELQAGRYFTQEEGASNSRVCVLGHLVWNDLFGREDPINKSIRIAGQEFRVIGLFKNTANQGFRNPNDVVYTPIITAMQQLFHIQHIQIISCKARPDADMDRAQAEIDSVLMKQHHLSANATKDFIIFSLDDFYAVQDEGKSKKGKQ